MESQRAWWIGNCFTTGAWRVEYTAISVAECPLLIVEPRRATFHMHNKDARLARTMNSPTEQSHS
jgi:hypothetical protein